jgi:hypothetical protein
LRYLGGSNTIAALLKNQAGVAQLVERLTCNEDVVGSNPITGSIFINQLLLSCRHALAPGAILLFPTATKLGDFLFAEIPPLTAE